MVDPIYIFMSFTKVPFNAKKYFFSYSSVAFQNFSFATLACVQTRSSNDASERIHRIKKGHHTVSVMI